MARQFYKEHLQLIPAVQNKENDLVALEDFAPGKIEVIDGLPHLVGPAGPELIPVNDWLMDDPAIGWITVLTNQAFQSRFEAGGPNYEQR